jgi:hypothetical protein
MFQPPFVQWGVKSVSRGDREQQGGKLLRLLSQYVQELGLCTVPSYTKPLFVNLH